LERLQGVEGVRPTAFSTAYTYHKMKSIVQDFVGEAISGGGRVLDVGCNRGYDLLRLSETYRSPDLRLYGLDVSRDDVRVAVERANSAKKPESFAFLLSVVEKIPFRDDAFDAIICSEVVEHLPDPDAALREISRVLRPGGVLALTTPNPGNRLHKLRKFLPGDIRAKTDEWREMQHEIDKNRRMAVGVNLPHISELSAKEWCEKCRAAGLQVTDVRRGSLLFGDPYLEGHPVQWAAAVMADRLLDRISNDWSWQVLIKARKGATTTEEARVV
jgi:ubiquinone/menaquinone biosynthesis C-methylase UbiE